MKEFFTERMSSRLSRFIGANPFLIIGIFVALAVLSILYTRGHLEFWTERNVLLSQDSPAVKEYRTYKQELTHPNEYLIVVLESKDPDLAKKFASDLGQRLEKEPDVIEDVFYRLPLEQFRRQALLYLEAGEIQDLATKIEKHENLLKRLASSPSLTNLLRIINKQISRALVQTAVSGLFSEEKDGEGEKETEDKVDPDDLRLLSSLMDSLYTWLTDAPRFRSPWGSFIGLGGGLSEEGFFVDEDRGWVLVFAYPRDVEASFNREGPAIEKVREHVRDLSRKIPGVTVGITGNPALSSEEMSHSLRDMTRAMILALLLVTALFVLGFGEAGRPLIAVFALGVGIVWTLGWLCLTVGHLTILSMAFGSILIGLGIDFGIHVIARYEKEFAVGLTAQDALEATLHRVGKAIFSAAITSSAAFLALGFSGFRGIREFGWIAGCGVLFCFVTQMLLLPSFLIIMDRGKTMSRGKDKRAKAKSVVLEKVLGRPSLYPKWVLACAGLLSLFAFGAFGRTSFDYNLLHLQAKGTEAVTWELKLIEAQGNSSTFAVDMAETLDEAREKATAYEKLPLVSKVDSLVSFLPTDPSDRLEQIHRLVPLLEDVELSKKSPPSPTPKHLKSWLNKIRFKLREEEEKETTGGSVPSSEVEPPPDTVAGARFRTERVLRLLEKPDEQAQESGLNQYQDRLFVDLGRKLDVLKAALDPVPVTLQGLPDLLKTRLMGKNGKWFLHIYPNENVWELEPQERFVEQLRSVNPKVTGAVINNYEATRSLLNAYLQGGVYAVCAILVILFVDFRRPLLVLFALLPLFFGSLWTLLGMYLLKISFNPANLVIIPLLVGIGVDNGIHVVRHFLSGSSSDEEVAGSSTGRAITLSTLTTMAGFGSLMIARHQGIFSIGALLSLAMACCLAASLILLPSILKVLPANTRHRLWSNGHPKCAGFSTDSG